MWKIAIAQKRSAILAVMLHLSEYKQRFVNPYDNKGEPTCTVEPFQNQITHYLDLFKFNKELTEGGLILHMPVLSAIGLIFAMYPNGSWNSSHVGSKTGASGGGIKSPSTSIMIFISTSQIVLRIQSAEQFHTSRLLCFLKHFSDQNNDR